MSMYVITHKDYHFPNSDYYIPLVVGKSINNIFLNDRLNTLYDNVADNISDLNKEFCELTAYYWLWKNSKDDIIGVCHYRRYFGSSQKNLLLSDDKYILSKDEIVSSLDSYDLIIPKKTMLGSLTIFWQYYKCHYVKDILYIRDIIEKKYPEYISSFDMVMNQTTFYSYNMLITKKAIFNDYCEWLFNVLFDLKENIDLSRYSTYQKRLFGFLSERLFTVWVCHNIKKYKILEVEIVSTEDVSLAKRPLVERFDIKVSNFKFMLKMITSRVIYKISR